MVESYFRRKLYFVREPPILMSLLYFTGKILVKHHSGKLTLVYREIKFRQKLNNLFINALKHSMILMKLFSFLVTIY